MNGLFLMGNKPFYFHSEEIRLGIIINGGIAPKICRSWLIQLNGQLQNKSHKEFPLCGLMKRADYAATSMFDELFLLRYAMNPIRPRPASSMA
jgi:hypothetical protein